MWSRSHGTGSSAIRVVGLVPVMGGPSASVPLADRSGRPTSAAVPAVSRSSSS